MDTPSPTGNNAAFTYRIVHLPQDEAGVSKYMGQYKAFRLLSLQIAPEAFSSTYAREVAFDDTTWRARLSNSQARTFMAIKDSGQIVSASTTLGPLKYAPDAMPAADNPWTALQGQNSQGKDDPPHFRLNAVFTLPEARRKGISKILIERSITYIRDEAQVQGKSIVFSVAVEVDNRAAKALYEAVGFVEIKRLAALESGIGRGIVLLEYRLS